jgi:hypothetical protein
MRDRSKLISIEISDKAKKIYDDLPHKGEFVSDAIIEKWAKEHGEVFTPEQIEAIKGLIEADIRLEDIEWRLKELEGKK